MSDEAALKAQVKAQEARIAQLEAEVVARGDGGDGCDPSPAEMT